MQWCIRAPASPLLRRQLRHHQPVQQLHVHELPFRIHRVRAGLTQKDAADKLLISESLMGAVERAERIPTLELLADADRVFDAGGALEACVELIDEEKYPAKFLGWARLERKARVVSAYETMLIPGLLQTEAYAYALYRARKPAYTEDEIVRHVEARLERQAVLMRTPPPYAGFVIEESILGRTLGGAEVLKEQLLHLLECMRRMNHLTVQVMPSRCVWGKRRGPERTAEAAGGPMHSDLMSYLQTVPLWLVR
ncbi:Scr1 family TA system antitoxin-like transcriptional regulator [Streptomyces sp. NPDC088246]|uniref:helix-turn-helix domain-containing protein n=1 Tax=Streptomyces sp. NPDC088246 TaxID=3365842 RepID=UPI00382AE0FE